MRLPVQDIALQPKETTPAGIAANAGIVDSNVGFRMEFLQCDLHHLRVRPYAAAVVVDARDAIADTDDAHRFLGFREKLASFVLCYR